MANPDEKIVSFEFEEKTYRLTFNNAGKREAEKFAGMSMGDMGAQMARNVLGSTTVLTAILWGASRKYSSRKILTPDAADALMDKVDAAEIDVTRGVTAALIACFTGEDKEEWVKNLTPDEDPEDEDLDEGPEPDGDPDEGDKAEGDGEEAPKAPKKGSKKPSGSPSEAGSSS